MTDTTVTQLHDITRWLPLLDDAIQTLTGLHSPRNGRGGSNPEERIPYGLGHALDDDTAGADGARTRPGMIAVLTMWADSIATHRREPRTMPAPTYLAATASSWQQALGDDLEDMRQDVNTLWDRLARITGHTDQPDTERACPACGGTLMHAATSRGLSDWTTCTDCDTWYPDGDIIDATRRHTITTTTDGQHWVTRHQALTIHPNLRADTLKKWVKRGHVDTQDGLVNLDQVNARAITRPHGYH